MGFLPIRELARIPARDPVGRFRPALAAADGAQNQEPGQKLLCSGFCAQDARALLFPGTHGLAAAAGDQAPQGAARGIAPIPLLHRMCNQRNPADDADRSGTMPERRKALGRVSLVPFFARAKKGTRPSAGRVEAFALKNKTSKSKDTGFRLSPE